MVVLRGLGGLHIMASFVNHRLGGTGGGPSTGGHMRTTGVQCSIRGVLVVASCVMYFAIKMLPPMLVLWLGWSS